MVFPDRRAIPAILVLPEQKEKVVCPDLLVFLDFKVIISNKSVNASTKLICALHISLLFVTYKFSFRYTWCSWIPWA